MRSTRLNCEKKIATIDNKFSYGRQIIVIVIYQVICNDVLFVTELLSILYYFFHVIYDNICDSQKFKNTMAPKFFQQLVTD